jgi:RNA polymerase-binding protein
MRGRRVGASGLGSQGYSSGLSGDRGGQVASRVVDFWCPSGHTTTVRLAANVAVPERWACRRCDETAGPDPDRLPPRCTPMPANGGRTPLEYLQMRRTPEDGERLLAEALDRLHASADAHGDRPARSPGRTTSSPANLRRPAD